MASVSITSKQCLALTFPLVLFGLVLLRNLSHEKIRITSAQFGLSDIIYGRSNRIIPQRNFLEEDRIMKSQGTTSSTTANEFEKLLETFGEVNYGADDHYGSEASVNLLEEKCGWDKNKANFKYEECPVNNISFSSQVEYLSVSPDDIDIVVPSIRDLHFLENWKEFVFGYHFIIIQDGDPSKKLSIPGWVDYELYNRKDIEKTLEKDSWIISERDASIRNFGFLVSKKPYIYSLDDDCLPMTIKGRVRVNPVVEHVRNLRRPSIPYFFNTLYDPYRSGSDFVRGYPYSLRDGVPTAISHGLWMNVPDYDAPTHLLKPKERNEIHLDTAVTVPNRIYYPMCSMNVAFDRVRIGPAFMQGLMGTGQPWGRYDDMFAGWASKYCSDKLGLGVKSGAPYIRHNKASNPFVNLKKEFMGLRWQEDIIRFFDELAVLPKKFSDSGECYLFVSNSIESRFKSVHPYFVRLGKAMKKWVSAWEKARDGEIQFYPSRSRTVKPKRTKGLENFKPKPKGKGELKVAAFTIQRNENVFLPIWLRYYASQFDPEDIFVLDNSSDDDSVSNIPYHVIRVESAEYFNHEWLVNQVKTCVKILLSAGYDYILFAESDEILVPSPALYPNGLMEFITKMKGEGRRASRSLGYNVFHDVRSEPDLDRNRPVLSQRRKWHLSANYGKPAITNIVLNWTVGFHTETDGIVPESDKDFYNIHLQRMDYKYFKMKAKWKAKQKFREDEAKIGLGIHHHVREEDIDELYWSLNWPNDFVHADTALEPIPMFLRDPPVV